MNASVASPQSEFNPASDLDGQTAPNHWLVRRAWSFVLLNALSVMLFSSFHAFAPPLRMVDNYQLLRHTCLLVVESLLLFSPCLFAGFLMWGPATRLFARITVGTTLLISALYFVDLSVFIVLREHLLTAAFFRFATAVVPHAGAYVTIGHWGLVLIALAAWIGAQWGMWKTTKSLCRRQRRPQDLSALGIAMVVIIMLAPVLVVVYPSYRAWDSTVDRIIRLAARHPIAASGFFRASYRPRFYSRDDQALRGKAQMLRHEELVEHHVHRFRDWKFCSRSDLRHEENAESADSRQSYPDILIVVAECLRPEVVTAKTMPNLYRRAQTGLWAQQHYSTGNTSCYGFFGLMFGLDPCWYEYAHQLPIGLFDGLKQLGYETGFFGYDSDFEMFDMQAFCSADRFDYRDLVPATGSTAGDIDAARRTADFLDRTGQYRTSNDRPRLALLYMYSPHENWHDDRDVIHTTADSIASYLDDSPRDHATYVEFLNSAHFLDRTVEPLMTDDRLVFVTGDHGQSFGEDARRLHGTGMTSVQIRVAMVGCGPGVPQVTTTNPTYHLDLIPTLLELLNVACSDSELFRGHSLVGSVPSGRIVSSRGLGSPKYLFVQPDRQADDSVLGYLGFLNWHRQELAPGSLIDQQAEALDRNATANWSDADLMRAWLAQRYGRSFAEIPDNPLTVLHETIRSERKQTRLKTIEVIGQLGDRANEFVDDLKRCLRDVDPVVRQHALDLIHDIARR